MHRLALSARAFLEPVWIRWHEARDQHVPLVLSTNTCGRSSLFLRDVLRHEGYAARWVNGVPRPAEDAPCFGPYGFFAGQRWESHAWVVCEGQIIDITADQFGAEPVIVTSLSDSRYSAGPEDTAYPEAVQARFDAVASVWPEWLSYKAEAGGDR